MGTVEIRSAQLLLYDFHALRFPDAAIHQQALNIRDKNNPLYGVRYGLEKMLTASDTPIEAKEAMIREPFKAMFLHQTVKTGQRAYDFFLTNANVVQQLPGVSEDLVDDAGHEMMSVDILPGQDVVSAMFDCFVQARAKRCTELEVFITNQQLTSSSIS